MFLFELARRAGPKLIKKPELMTSFKTDLFLLFTLKSYRYKRLIEEQYTFMRWLFVGGLALGTGKAEKH